jgi:hypothetical protein
MGRRGWCAAAVLACVGCRGGEPVDARWLEGFDLGWTFFNHRVSQVVARTDDDAAQVAFVGGTSTTGVRPTLPDGCDPSTCEEFPFLDTADIALYYGRIQTDRAAFADGAVTVVAGVDGASTTVSVPLPPGAPRAGFAMLRSLSLGTDVPLDGEAGCYDPANGWHPRRVRVALGPPTFEGDVARVTVDVAFEAGNSLEDVRACIDAVRDRAQVRFDLALWVVATREAVTEQEVVGGMSFPDPAGGVPAPQVPTDAAALDGAFGPDSVVGWRAVDMAFHQEDPLERGAYLRTWTLRVDPVGGTAAGQATNYSPGTQLSGFSYEFAGTVVGATLPGAVAHGFTAATAVPAALAEDGGPVLTALPYPSDLD